MGMVSKIFLVKRFSQSGVAIRLFAGSRETQGNVLNPGCYFFDSW